LVGAQDGGNDLPDDEGATYARRSLPPSAGVNPIDLAP
jgi:hypothetical protein